MPRYIVWALAIAAVFALAIVWTFSARAETKGDWFQGLMRPDVGGSCCDISDCKPTNARFVDGHWEAEFEGTMTPIPDGKILRDKDSWDGRAYLCALPGSQGRPSVFCFVR